MKFVAYLNGCPPGPKNKHKQALLWDFVQGVNSVGDQGILHQTRELLKADVAFIQGWVHQKSSTTPHLMLRRSVIDYQRDHKNRLLVADSNLFNYIDGNAKKDYIRYSFDGVFPTTGNYFNEMYLTKRWEQIFKNKNITLKPWRTQGNHILICTQRNGGWSMKGLDVPTWLDNIVNEIKKYSSRPIIVRGHPGDKYHKQYIDQKKYTLSNKPLLAQDLANAHAVVTYNSSPGVASAIEGVPVFVTDPDPKVSQAYEVANTDISQIENPKTFEREQWLAKLAMSHWNNEEIKSGEAWKHIRQFV